ncbi:hypothetical protein MRX96_057530 [Rhipicephalus microplus]
MTKLMAQASGKVEAKAKIMGDAPVPSQAKIAVVAQIQRRKTAPGPPYHQAPLSTTLQPIHTRTLRSLSRSSKVFDQLIAPAYDQMERSGGRVAPRALSDQGVRCRFIEYNQAKLVHQFG